MIDRALLARPALEAAPLLLGAVLTRTTDDGPVAVRLTEVEAYGGAEDPGSHAFRGERPRNRAMFGPPGHLYAYFTYGMHTCANVVCGPEGAASAVLLRAGEVVAGHDLALRRRGGARDRDLARGPARLVVALGIALADDGADLLGGGGWSLDPAPEPAEAVRGPRVGVAGDGGDGGRFPWRFWIDGDPTVSAYRPGGRRRPAGAARGPGAAR
ncbi:DNA-3-methyladenine glycosylase [Amnibacterium endophyticum]|uniref:Putative 3-methyladenine DNA glycosylase n=1 Tax=Amnibacterium endophyticum TaxID=2109337 RepID=A0ABW4LHR2_9MICO